MEHIEIDKKILEDFSVQLFKKIQKEFKPEAILFVAKGGYLLGSALAKKFNCSLIEIEAQRPEGKIKKILLKSVKLIPRKLRFKLREIELKLGNYNKNKDRNVKISELNIEKLKKIENILIVDDSIDTGNTVDEILKYLKLINNFNIKILALNVFDEGLKKINVDFWIYKNTMIVGSWSKDSKNYKEFMKEYLNYKKKQKRYYFQVDMTTENSHKKILERIKKESYVLEIGTAYGHMTKYLKEILNCNITGIEINKEMLNVAKKYLDLAINLDIQDTITLDKKLKNDRYDYIILGDILEHTTKVELILEVLKKKIKKKGEIIVSIPNVAHNCILMQLLKNDFNYQEQGILDKTHITFFTSESFKRVLKKVNLKVKKYDFTYMTPEYEKLNYNNYREFSCYENEVLLRHKNGHFFQNIYFLTKNDIKEAEIKNIDAYNFDKILIKERNKIILESELYNLEERIVLDIKDNINELKIYPSFRMRIIKNIKLLINEKKVSYNINEIYIKDNKMYTFGSGYIYINMTLFKGDKIEIEINFENLTEEKLKEIIIGEK